MQKFIDIALNFLKSRKQNHGTTAASKLKGTPMQTFIPFEELKNSIALT